MNHSIIKFGGSVITAPGMEDLFHMENTDRLARELYPHHEGCVVVHGTGHVGKPPAIRHGYYSTGILANANRLLAIEVKEAIRRLNLLVVRSLTGAGIPAVPLDIFHLLGEYTVQKSDTPIRDLLLRILSSGCVPVLYGDMIMTENGDFRVVSSDQITFWLARILKPENVVFLTDTEGVYEYPENSSGTMKARVIPLLQGSHERSFFRQTEPNKDVSGGMQRKVEIALETAKHCKICFIGSGLKTHLLEDFFNGDPIEVTYVQSY